MKRRIGARPCGVQLRVLERCGDCRGRADCAFAGMPESTRARFHAAAQSRMYGRGTSLFHQGDDPGGLFLVCAGWLKLVYVATHGRVATVALAGPGAIVGLREVLTNDPYDLSAEVLETTELAYIRRAEFLLLLDEHPQVSLLLLNAVSRETGGLIADLCETIVKLPAMDRLLHALQHLAEKAGRAGEDGTTIRLPLTVQDLADRIGCSRQWTSRLVAGLEDQDLIRRHHGWILLKSDWKSLRQGATREGCAPAGA